MATIYWVGGAEKTAQVVDNTITGTFESAAVYKLSINAALGTSHVVTTTGQADINAAIADLVNQWNASTHPWMSAVTASVNGISVRLTADVPGVPFDVSWSASGGTNPTVLQTIVTPSSGPNDLSTADNWSPSLPATGDTVIFQNSKTNICWGLDFFKTNSIELNKVIIYNTFTGRIGLNAFEFALSSDGLSVDSTIDEYRPNYLDVNLSDTGQLDIGVGNGAGSGRLMIRLSDTAFTMANNTVNVVSLPATTADADLAPLRLMTEPNVLTGAHVGTLNIYSGGVDLGLQRETDNAPVFAACLVDTVNVFGGNVRTGLVAKAETKMTVSGGTVSGSIDAQTIAQDGGAVVLDDTVGFDSYTQDGGTAVLQRGVSAGGLNKKLTLNSGQMDFTNATKPITVDNIELHSGATLTYRPGTFSWTALTTPDTAVNLQVT